MRSAHRPTASVVPRTADGRRPRFPRLAAGIFACVAAAALATGCATSQAASVPDGPPLAVPTPPPRILPPTEEIIVEARPAPPAESPAPPPRTPQPRTQPRQEPRPEPQQPVAAQPPPPAATPPPAEPREVRAVPSGSAAAEEKKVRDVMAQASRDLNRVDYRKLSKEGQSQYDQSKRFAEQADEALKERNFVYAMTLADKAANLAAELAGSR